MIGILRLEAWKLFLILIIPILLYFLVDGLIASILFLLINMTWLWSLKKTLSSKQGVKVSFMFKLMFGVVCLILIYQSLPDSILESVNDLLNEPGNMIFGLFLAGFIFILTFGGIACYIGLNYNISKQIQNIDNNQDSIFWKLFLYPYGIWTFQDKIREILNAK